MFYVYDVLMSAVTFLARSFRQYYYYIFLLCQIDTFCSPINIFEYFTKQHRIFHSMNNFVEFIQICLR